MHKIWIAAFLMVSVPAFAAVEVKDGNVTANVQAEELSAVLGEIAAQAGLEVSVDGSAASEMVYANFENLPIGAAIRKLLEGTSVNFAVIAGRKGTPTAIYVSRSESPGAPPKKLDSRPVTAPARGMIALPGPPQPTTVPLNVPQGGSVRNPGNQKPEFKNAPGQNSNAPPAGNEVLTAGSFSGQSPQGAQPNPPKNNKLPIQNKANSDEDDNQ